MSKMAVAGIDVGSMTTKTVILEGDVVLGKCAMVSAETAEEGAHRALEQALSQAGLKVADLKIIVATGVGRKEVTFATRQKTSLSCLARGIRFLFPSVRTVFEIGAESSTVARVDARGLVEESASSDRCASGTGTFLNSMAKLMQMPLEEMAVLSLQAAARAEISNTCAVFAEQEVISHVHRVPPTPKADIIAGINGSMATRITGMAKRIGVTPDIALCGGAARNVGFARCMEEELKQKVFVPEEPQLVAALGAAVIAQAEGGK